MSRGRGTEVQYLRYMSSPGVLIVRGYEIVRGGSLHCARLGHADLGGVDLSRTDLSGADLTGADLSGANLSGSDFTVTNLVRANLAGSSSIRSA